MQPFQEVHEYLKSFINHEVHLGQTSPPSFKLERVHQLLRALGNPHKKLKIIHVAGSKGKGSICAMTASILEKAGYKVGLYTSPHINHYRERIRILKPKAVHSTYEVEMGGVFPDCISEEELSSAVDNIKPAVEKIRSQKELGVLSFFEVYTALALSYFDQQDVDFVVLETGLGGRLDATNAADSLVAVIAPISLEHTKILGDTVAQIAEEKAAIIKSDRQKAVIAIQEAEAMDVLAARCRHYGIDPVCVGRDVLCEPGEQSWNGQTFDVECWDKTRQASRIYYNVVLPLLGRHQRENAAASIAVAGCLRDLGFKISMKAIWEGLKHVFWPGRFEVVGRMPFVVLDSAHNAASVKVLAETMQEIFKNKNIIVVLGLSADKDREALVAGFSQITRNIIFTKADHPRALHLERAVSVSQALDLAYRNAHSEDVILIAGSVFVVAEARKIIKERGRARI